jgi:hypothetical protein
MHTRIEKSGFRSGEYVGYCDGAWRIRKVAPNLWQATKQNGADTFRASSLDAIGNGLDQRANLVNARLMFGGQ